jgi:hypothetical protein
LFSQLTMTGSRDLYNGNVKAVEPFYSRECACGCGQRPKSATSEYVRNHDKRVPRPESRECACGCGELAAPGRLYVSGHNARVDHPFAGQRHSDATKERLASFTGEQASSYKHGWAGTPTYVSWAAMKGRCFDPGNASYPTYGARGITVCERWLDFENFLADMGERPSLDHSIDRRDENGNYEPGNCRWLTRAEQNARRKDPGGWIKRRANHG